MLRQPQLRGNRRNSNLISRSPQRSHSNLKNSLNQFQNTVILSDLSVNQLNRDSIKQRIVKKEEIYQDYFPSFIYGKHQYQPAKVNKHLRLLHQGLLYSSIALGSPSEAFIKQKMTSLPESGERKQKILMLDLDQTLIHSVEDHQEAEVQFICTFGVVRFNVRPFCQIFLQTMSKSFQIYIFTSAIQEYAKAIVDHLNSNKIYIQGILHRDHCLQTKRGLRIKDLRIIKNRDLSKIVIVDNLVHSFGLQLDNGIPILDFTNQKQDKQLLGLAKVLRKLEDAEDVRVFLKEKFDLKKYASYSEELFLELSYQKSVALKQRQTIG